MRNRPALSSLVTVVTIALALASPGVADEPAALEEGERALAACRAAGARGSTEEAAAEAARAEEAFGQALATHPVRSHLGIARALLECRIEAAPMMEKVALLQRIEHHLGSVLEADPGHGEARFLYGALLYNVPPFLERTDEAIHHFEALLEGAAEAREPPPAEAFLYLGDLYTRQGREAEARALWERGRRRYPGVEAFAERLAGEGSEGTGAPAEASPGSEGTGSEGAARTGPPAIRLRLEREVARPEVPGIAVGLARGEELVLLDGFGLADVENGVPVTPDTVFRIGSITKQLTAAVALRLVEEEAMAIDDPAARWLPAGHREALGPLTVRHLLTHTGGLPRDVVGAAGWIERSLAAPRVAEPGERFSYSNLGYALLGRIIEAAGGEAYARLLRRLVAEPAGLRATRPCDEREIVPHRAEGYTWRGDRLLNDDRVRETPALLYAGGLCSTARDLLRWLQALHGGEVLGPEAYGLMVTPPPVRDPGGTAYAAGIRMAGSGGRRVMRHSGGIAGFLSESAYYPEERIAVVVLTNSEATHPRQLAREIVDLVGTPDGNRPGGHGRVAGGAR